jgi:hypothetical protein
VGLRGSRWVFEVEVLERRGFGRGQQLSLWAHSVEYLLHSIGDLQVLEVGRRGRGGVGQRQRVVRRRSRMSEAV